MPDVATIQPTELSPRGETTDAVSPAVISIVTVLLDLDAASLTPGKSRKVLTMQRKRRPLSARKRKPHFCRRREWKHAPQGGNDIWATRRGPITGRTGTLTKKPLASASLSDIRDDTIVLTGSMSLIATALFSGSGDLMKFLQANIPATAMAVDSRYRQWVFVLSKVAAMRVAQKIASHRTDPDESPVPLVFPRRIPSWRAHLRGDRAYLMHIDLVPPLLDALRDNAHLRMIKDPSLRFDTSIPWEIRIEGGSELHAVWRDAQAQSARTISLARSDDAWTIERDESSGNCHGDCLTAGPEVWLGHFLANGERAATGG